ncbi:Uncharacterized protein APZ42_025492 [Daphnia magna]|uniref:Uncharacterized protein n=1 Tax=Daphnia magna TaxID=35525 RepID=A0A164T0S4_9CRUS|nr:Uncharacterized protein APZ42_025492 [Daphnia magna]
MSRYPWWGKLTPPKITYGFDQGFVSDGATCRTANSIELFGFAIDSSLANSSSKRLVFEETPVEVNNDSLTKRTRLASFSSSFTTQNINENSLTIFEEQKNAAALRDEIKILEEHDKKKMEDLNELREENAALREEIKILEEHDKKKMEDLNELREENAALWEEIKISEEHDQKKMEDLNELSEENAFLRQQIKIQSEDDNSLSVDGEIMLDMEIFGSDNDLNNYVLQDEFNDHCLAYIAGYLITKVEKAVKVPVQRSALFCNPDDPLDLSLANVAELRGKRAIVIPSQSVFILVQKAEQLFPSLIVQKSNTLSNESIGKSWKRDF